MLHCAIKNMLATFKQLQNICEKTLSETRKHILVSQFLACLCWVQSNTDYDRFSLNTVQTLLTRRYKLLYVYLSFTQDIHRFSNHNHDTSHKTLRTSASHGVSCLSFLIVFFSACLLLQNQTRITSRS